MKMHWAGTKTNVHITYDEGAAIHTKQCLCTAVMQRADLKHGIVKRTPGRCTKCRPSGNAWQPLQQTTARRPASMQLWCSEQICPNMRRLTGSDSAATHHCSLADSPPHQPQNQEHRRTCSLLCAKWGAVYKVEGSAACKAGLNASCVNVPQHQQSHTWPQAPHTLNTLACSMISTKHTAVRRMHPKSA